MFKVGDDVIAWCGEHMHETFIQRVDFPFYWVQGHNAAESICVFRDDVKPL